MREVAWVVFDEVHYLRDKCKYATSHYPSILTWW